MIHPGAWLDHLSHTAQSLYNVWTLVAGLTGGLIVALRSPIARTSRRFLGALRETNRLLIANDSLTAQLANSKLENRELREGLGALRSLYETIKIEVDHFGHKLDEAEEAAAARDALIDAQRDEIAKHVAHAKEQDDQIGTMRAAADALTHEITAGYEQVTMLQRIAGDLTHDRDELVAWGGGLVAQLHAAGIEPGCAMPILRSVSSATHPT